jgi:hypothetical protein
MWGREDSDKNPITGLFTSSRNSRAVMEERQGYPYKEDSDEEEEKKQYHRHKQSYQTKTIRIPFTLPNLDCGESRHVWSLSLMKDIIVKNRPSFPEGVIGSICIENVITDFPSPLVVDVDFKQINPFPKKGSISEVHPFENLEEASTMVSNYQKPYFGTVTWRSTNPKNILIRRSSYSTQVFIHQFDLTREILHACLNQCKEGGIIDVQNTHPIVSSVERMIRSTYYEKFAKTQQHRFIWDNGNKGTKSIDCQVMLTFLNKIISDDIHGNNIFGDEFLDGFKLVFEIYGDDDGSYYDQYPNRKPCLSNYPFSISGELCIQFFVLKSKKTK